MATSTNGFFTAKSLLTGQKYTHETKVHNPWIDAFSDPKADLQTFSTCMALSDLNADNDYKLILGDFGNGIQVKLKVYKGTSLNVELPLLTQPVAIVCLYTDRTDPRIPGIAVATGSNVLVYRNCRPYFKFTLPPQEGSSLEADVWSEISNADQLIQVLKDLSLELGFTNLSSPSQNVLLMDPSLRDEFISSNTHFMIKKQMVITCVTTLRKYADNDRDVSCVLLATESAQLFVMDPETFTLVNEFKLPDVCCNIAAYGVYLVEYCVLMSFRNGSLFALRGNSLRYITQLFSLPVSINLFTNKIVTANMDSSLSCYNMKGRKYWAVKLPDNPLYMTDILLSSFALHLIAVALSKGNIYFYNDSTLVHVLTTLEPIYSMIFGKYGQEEHALISISSSGALDIRLLKRTAQFSNDYASYIQHNAGIRPHDIKFLVPKKSKLFLEQSLRERQKCREMHTWFHHSWTSLKVLTSESYISALHNASVTHNESLKMIVEVVGLGPRMKIRMILQNMSPNIVPVDLKVTFIYEPKLYVLHNPILYVPMLVRGTKYFLETFVTCQMPVVGLIRVLVVSSAVLLSTTVNMPDC
ncbi:Bardet-Biedl syndrome 1 protein homolog isoform X2 [Cimex lectularius]|uniref:Bardet-Biedl syndrome 1 n=1 Tax=Cimex lectularius TaxID=79782 RepID=A0A8I6TMJ2_CIMLE|nr:Bardet-Biedl syndrome 1 protein homolog isoform X2 [Cimex lectularius]